MKKRYSIVFVALAIIFASNSKVESQTYFELFNSNYNYSPNNTYNNSNTRLTIVDINSNIKVPYLMKNGDAMIIGITGNRLFLNNITDTVKNRTLSSINLQIGYNKIIGNQWQALFVALPKVSSDFKDITKEDFQMGGILLFTYIKKTNLKYKIGVYYNQEFWGPFIVPILGFDWQPNDKWDIFGSLPISATTSYHISKKFNTGVYFQAPTSSYRLCEEEHSCYLARATNELYWFNEFYITKNIVFQEKLSYSLGRSFRIYNKNDKIDAKISAFNIGDHRQQLNQDVSNGLVFDVKVMFRIPNKK